MLVKKIKTPIFVVLFFISIFHRQALAGSCHLSLDEYLCQVRNQNLGVAGSVLSAKGARQRVGEGRLLMMPHFFAEGQYLKNSYDPDWSPIAGNRNSLQSYKAGISQTTPFGVEGKIYYNYQHQSIAGIPPLYNDADFTASSPIAEVNIPLSRNFGGRETRANALLLDSQARLRHLSERYKNTALMAEAESAYWRLATFRNIIIKQKQSVDRANRIKQWVENRVKLRLGEDADLLQASAAFDAKRLDLQSAINDAKLAELNFNTLRGVCQENVPEQLASIPQINCLVLPPCPGVRDDLRIAEQQTQIDIAQARLGLEKNKPDIDLYASYALNGNNPSSNEAIAESFTTNYPSTAIGLRLSLPLDFWQTKRDRNAYRNEIKGAKCLFKQKVFENDRRWQEIVLRIHNAKQRYDLAAKLEQIQLRKLDAERQRLMYGKTTTYQVLMFEQDYQNAQIATLSIQEEVLELIAQLKTFGA